MPLKLEGPTFFQADVFNTGACFGKLWFYNMCAYFLVVVYCRQQEMSSPVLWTGIRHECVCAWLFVLCVFTCPTDDW